MVRIVNSRMLSFRLVYMSQSLFWIKKMITLVARDPTIRVSKQIIQITDSLRMKFVFDFGLIALAQILSIIWFFSFELDMLELNV